MNASALLDRLRALGVGLSVSVAGRLRIEAPAGALTEELRWAMVANRDELVRLVSATASLGQVVHYPPCPGCGSTAASMLLAGDPLVRCARCAPVQVRARRQWGLPA